MTHDEINALTEKVIGCAFRVSNTLGCGFLEKVYENAFADELRKHGLDVMQQAPIKVHYEHIVVGEYVADLLVSNAIIIELKAAKEINAAFTAQCLNYL
ncbi:GxxExxY protein, partial [Rhodopirellula baltica]